MKEEMFAQLVTELIEAQGQALAILAQALCQQVDASRLKGDLQHRIAAAKKLQSTSPIALKIATEALAAVHAEAMFQARPASEGPHPKRAN